MFGAFSFGQGYFGQASMGGTIPATFVFGNVIEAKLVSGDAERTLVSTEEERCAVSDDVVRTAPFSG
jgi:hypothetical protein